MAIIESSSVFVVLLFLILLILLGLHNLLAINQLQL